jgi:hypothetical protein
MGHDGEIGGGLVGNSIRGNDALLRLTHPTLWVCMGLYGFVWVCAGLYGLILFCGSLGYV